MPASFCTTFSVSSSHPGLFSGNRFLPISGIQEDSLFPGILTIPPLPLSLTPRSLLRCHTLWEAIPASQTHLLSYSGTAPSPFPSRHLPQLQGNIQSFHVHFPYQVVSCIRKSLVGGGRHVNHYFKCTVTDAVREGAYDAIGSTEGVHVTPESRPK